MPIPFKVKVVKIGGSLRVTLPKPICDYLSIAKGDTLTVHVSDSEIIVKKIND